ncbi:pyridoxamine 5'-phosphate oxidase-domain-containing protein [Calycina marina]|uniref:Pyridoxamine 5'-phosphate oxidase-domain-containing protein n=1 Tax=Calycina marina TaxID=1763456 RepID=A0A9P7ZB65_9HELO|nr:pyridoxamine 5'-phosphate oxidase-domain-containing protein [Calycina marina]
MIAPRDLILVIDQIDQSLKSKTTVPVTYSSWVLSLSHLLRESWFLFRFASADSAFPFYTFLQPASSNMYLSTILIFAALLTAAVSQDVQISYDIPTSRESAVFARRILHLTPIGTLSTTFPSSTKEGLSISEDRPADVGGLSIGLPDYIADCESSGNPTILSLSIATTFKNVAAGSNISLSLSWVPPYSVPARTGFQRQADDYYPASLPRFALVGYLEKIPENEVKSLALTQCFTKAHKDAKYWLPGNHIHFSEWVRLVVKEVYWIGGFGDRAYIGWIPIEEWQSVTREEWEKVKLPRESKSWKEWAVDSFGRWDL